MTAKKWPCNTKRDNMSQINVKKTVARKLYRAFFLKYIFVPNCFKILSKCMHSLCFNSIPRHGLGTIMCIYICTHTFTTSQPCPYFVPSKLQYSSAALVKNHQLTAFQWARLRLIYQTYNLSTTFFCQKLTVIFFVFLK